MASRTVTLWPLILTFVSTGVGGATLLGYMENGYTLGMGQQWIHITMMVAVIVLAFFLLKRIRLLGEKHNMVTIGDYTALRYGESARIPTVISFLFAYCAMTGMQFVAIASILNLTIGLNMTAGIIIGCILLTIKTYLGGLKAVDLARCCSRNDTYNWCYSTILCGYLSTQVVGVIFKLMHSSQNQSDMLNFLNITPNEILIYLLTLAFYQFIRQDVWQRIWAAKDLKTARNGYGISMIIAVALGAMTVFIGVYAKFGLNLDIAETPLVYYNVIQEVFPFPLVLSNDYSIISSSHI
ncbi:sodium:solute symporter family protein [Staphylococcus pseudoxylosus]|uniref:sodium:solute symporter family protein n=1 Tax=Staphylococcus pseudoxylosus TaxID=2282419 RepID=UPI00298F210A|nr:hypothetical protein [Staphylococcus pseudoxylosus]MDW8544613.1 hypothetical protein [Staphylococcus pseudoxylosus]